MLLEADAEPDIVGSDGFSPMHWAAKENHLGKNDELCIKMRSFALKMRICVLQPMNYVLQLINFAGIATLLSDYGAEVDLGDNFDMTPLFIASDRQLDKSKHRITRTHHNAT